MNQMAEEGDKYNIKVVERCFQILDLAASRHAPISVQDVRIALDVNVNMAFRLLTSIQNAGYMDKDPDTGLFSLSLRCLSLSSSALRSLEIRKLAMPYLEMLWHQFPRANMNLAVRNGDDIMIIDRIDGQSLPRTYFTPGRVIPFYCSGVGKVLSCELPESDIDRMILSAGGLKAFTPKTITDRASLLAELAQAREQGVARDRNEYIVGDNCSAVPVRDAQGHIIAAISASALEPNMSADEIEKTIPGLRQAAARISGLLGYYS